jgi:hypothetical protein
MVVGMLVDWTGDFLVGGYFIMVLGLAIFMLTFLIQDRRESCVQGPELLA